MQATMEEWQREMAKADAAVDNLKGKTCVRTHAFAHLPNGSPVDGVTLNGMEQDWIKEGFDVVVGPGYMDGYKVKTK